MGCAIAIWLDSAFDNIAGGSWRWIDGVVTTFVPWVAARESARSHAQSAPRAVAPNRLVCITGTARIKAAARADQRP